MLDKCGLKDTEGAGDIKGDDVLNHRASCSESTKRVR